MKTHERKVKFRLRNARIKMDPLPDRTPDAMSHGFPNAFGEQNQSWIEGTHWIYAGASPIKSTGCSCQKQNFHLDWFKRSYVPESYRHSIGVLDTNGNLIMHLGKWGNFDDAAKMAKGGPITVTFVRFISGTDTYLAYEDNGERVILLKNTYHAEETVPLGGI
jgi:hypothetical protein